METTIDNFSFDSRIMLHEHKRNTVYIGFYDQPRSRGSRSLNPMEVAKLSGFPLGIATRRSLKAIYAQSRLSPLGITTSTVAISL